MRSSSRPCTKAIAFLAGILFLLLRGQAARAQALPQAPGFLVERFYPAAPGGGWFVMDALDLHGGLGGILALNLGYSNNALRIQDGSQSLAVVQHQAFADVGAAITYDRWRVYLNLATPVVIAGQSGTVDGLQFTAPVVNLGSLPDTLVDARLGLDVRIFGGPHDRFRFGLGAQLFVPFGNPSDYDTDGTFRGMLRALFAGNTRSFLYAGQLGVHIRPLDDPATPGSPQGSELLFGFAAGGRIPVGPTGSMAVIIGPELYGATALRSLFSAGGTALEGLLSGRLEGTRSDRFQLRVKLGVGAGLNAQFGAPEWRLVLGLEAFSHNQRG